MSDKRAVFFCSATSDIDPVYNQAAREIVRAACLSGYDIVSGGTVKGTMNVVCDEASHHDVENIGVIPRFMAGLEHPALTQCIWTDRMSERKDGMREGATVAIALPGGIGTLDEFAETCCLKKMGLFGGKVIAFNLNGFYDPFKAQLGVFVKEGMLSREAESAVLFPETVEEVKSLL